MIGEVSLSSAFSLCYNTPSGGVHSGMMSAFFPSMRVIFFGHSKWLWWCNYIASCNISNMGFPPQVEVHVKTNSMYLQISDAFHSHLLRRGEGSLFPSVIFLDDMLRGIGYGVGLGGAHLTDLLSCDHPFHLM